MVKTQKTFDFQAALKHWRDVSTSPPFYLFQWALWATTFQKLGRTLIGYILIKLDAKYYYNVTLYKAFISKVYDLVGQPSYTLLQCI